MNVLVSGYYSIDVMLLLTGIIECSEICVILVNCGVLSPLLFAVYVNETSNSELKKSGLGCHF